MRKYWIAKEKNNSKERTKYSCKPHHIREGKIGARSIVAAGSVVTKSFPADCIIGGNPAKIIRRIGPEDSL